MKKYKNATKLFKISLFLLGIGIIFSLGINTTTAANPSNIYVNGSSGNDNWNGLNSTYISGINGPKATITNATGTVKSDGTIYIASGTYNESNIQINTNMNIIGENQKNTIINGQQSGNSIFTIANGVNFTIINLTLTNNTAYDGGAIYNGGTLTIENSTFTNNTATDNGKGGGVIYNGGTLTIDNSTFINNTAEYGGVIDNGGSLTVDNSTFTNNTAVAGGAIFNFGNAITVDNSTFTNNTANYGGAIDNAYYSTLSVENSTFTGNNAIENGYGGAIYNNAGPLNIENSTFTNNTAPNGYGGAIYNDGTLTVNNSTFTNNTAPYGGGSGYGGAIYNDGTLTVDNSTFTNNHAALEGGAIYNSGTAVVNFNRIIGNSTNGYGSTNAISNNNGTVDARYNWWGSNTNPFANISGSDVFYDPWIVLTVSANPTTINVGGTSTVTADLLHDSNGVYHDPVNGHIPDGITVNFSSDGLGTVNPETNNTTNGSANATFTGHFGGVSEVSTTIDNQTVTTPITINTSAYLYLQITSSNKYPKIGEPFTLTYKLGNKGPDNASNVIMTIPLPSDFKVSNITGNGNWTYNPTTKTIIWTLTNVTIGDPYLYITGKINTSGIYIFSSNITSETNNLNLDGVTPITITATNPITPTNPINNSTNSPNSTILNAATNTIPMQHTGIPIAGLLFGILSVIGGSIISRKK